MTTDNDTLQTPTQETEEQDIDTLLDQVTNEFLDEKGNEIGLDNPEPTEEPVVEVEVEFSELAPDELALVEQANLNAREVQELQRLPKAARQAALGFISSRKTGGGGDRQEGTAPLAPSQEIDLSQLTKALIRPVPEKVISRFAEAMPGLDREVVQGLADELQQASAEPLAKLAVSLIGLIKDTQARAEESEFTQTARFLKSSLTETYPELKTDAVYTALVKNPATRRLVSAFQEQGMDRMSAIERAITDRAAADFGGVRPGKRPDPKKESRQRSLRSTPEPGTRTRQGTPKVTQKFNVTDLDAALDAAFDLVNKRQT